jgi:hypothetical protein
MKVSSSPSVLKSEELAFDFLQWFYTPARAEYLRWVLEDNESEALVRCYDKARESKTLFDSAEIVLEADFDFHRKLIRLKLKLSMEVEELLVLLRGVASKRLAEIIAAA